MSTNKMFLLLNIYMSQTFKNTPILAQLVNNETIAVGSSTYDGYVALQAVDGDFSQNVSRCFHSGVDSSITVAWLRIDLGGVYSVKSVKFWYRGDSKYIT